jgi:2-oxoisovalerate dehydrogenase E2 component (dihydrolipoyl transacylase)
MKIFKLPDLGEGLPDAIIREWHVKVGDTVKTDQTIASMETAKALVEVPAPLDGTIEKLFGAVDDTIETGHPLVGFEGESDTEEDKDAGTVVGTIEESNSVIQETPTHIIKKSTQGAKATPAVRALAKRLAVDLASISPKGDHITKQEVEQAAKTSASTTAIPAGMEKLSPARQAMVLSMNKSHQNVVPVTLVDDANIATWKGQDNITIRIIRALQAACQSEPMLNATFSGEHMAFKHNEAINLGLAVDTPHGLFVPVLKNIAALNDQALRQQINAFKSQAQTKTMAPEDLQGATIILSNFGALAGRYANPVVMPPMTAIVGVGKLYEGVIAVEGQPAVRPMLPLSITADHRAVTGGEVARFLKTMIDSLEA